jgi:uncharacterized repeat protein (TIGR03803 family)
MIYKITPKGALTVLYSFCSQTDCSDGYGPGAVPIQATDGNFYGTTLYGGAYGDSFDNNYGTVYKLTAQGVLTTLHSFDGTDGASPTGLMQATDGDFYGITEDGAYNSGTIYKITPQGTLTTLYNFCSETGCPDGSGPTGALVQDTDGDLYGTTAGGGTGKYGTVFKITPGGVLTTLYNFDFGDGSGPNGLVQATDGNFYGTTFNGGANAYGTVFEVTAKGALTLLHSFDNTDGSHPAVGISQATSGLFYGTAWEGGTDNIGTVFSLSVGLGRFIETIPTVGRMGEGVTILGNDLKGSTAVSFNGTPATTFTASNTEIKVAVPTGATTGTVEVTTATGETLKSNVAFRVKP